MVRHSHLNLIRLLSQLASSLAGTTSATPSTSRPVIAAPQPFRPAISSSVPADRADARHRPHSTPPRIHPPGVESSDSERDGRCSPLLGLFTSTRGRGKQREQSQDRHPSRSRKPVVGAPMMRTRTASREGPSVPPKPPGGARLPSFEFERGGGAEVRRSTSHNGHHRRVVASHGHGNGNGHAHTHANHRARGHAHSNSLDMRTRGHSHNTHHTHARSPTHTTHPVRSHTHPQPNQQHRSTMSPHAAMNSPPPPQGPTGASAASQSTAGTAATNTTTGAAVTGGTGSWGRVARTIDWVRGVGVHPPFAFESAASSTASASGERRPGTGSGGGGGGGGGADIRERERDRDRERTRRHVVQTPQVPAAPTPALPPASPGKSVGSGTTGTGRWEQREVELGLGLTWAPSKIRVREWTPGGTLPAQLGPEGEARAARAQREMVQRVLERDGARRTRERLAEYEMGYARSRSRSRKDKEVTGRFREVLGAEGFEAFKKYVRRFDADIIPLEGASGLLGRVERLLDKAPTRHVGTREKREMLDDLVRIVRESEW
ncbi:hypothetical protein H4582DRAFT_10101 [Lactarius indigo]|nr:hypothetical protein H4582DRAFT_10101 [Lactarius indigo]